MKRFGVGRVGAVSIMSRVLLFAAVSLFALFFAGFNLFVLSLAWNALSGASWAVYNSAVNVILFSSMGPTGKGGVLGGYGAVTNFGTVIGAFLSGYISFYIGYTTTFAASAVLMLISYLILRPSL